MTLEGHRAAVGWDCGRMTEGESRGPAQGTPSSPGECPALGASGACLAGASGAPAALGAQTGATLDVPVSASGCRGYRGWVNRPPLIASAALNEALGKPT